LCGLLFGLLCTASPLFAQMPEEEVPLKPCRVDTTAPGQGSPRDADEPADCYEFGASVGELGWHWRKNLPNQVRWLTRKDAARLCAQAQTEFGQKVNSPVAGGCVFLAPSACTIVTNGPVSPTAIGNAVRYCVS
jgi:hypothetical protein